MRKLSGHQCKLKMSGSKKKSEQEHVRHFLHKTCYQEVSGSFTLQSCKTTAKKCTKKCAAHAKLLFCYKLETCCCVFTVLVSFAAQHYTILYFVSANYKYRALLLTLAKSLYFGHASINTDNGLFPVSRVTNSHISSIPLNRHTYQRIPYQNGE